MAKAKRAIKFEMINDLKGLKGSREFRQVKKNESILPGERVDNIDITTCNKLIGYKFNARIALDVCDKKKDIEIIALYPHMALGQYYLGKDDKEGCHYPKHPMKIGFSISDLVEMGVLTFIHGYPEVLV